MLGDLTKLTEDQLLEYTRLILLRPGVMLTPFDRTELHQINAELTRREQLQHKIKVESV